MITNVGRQMGKYVWVTAGRVGLQSASHVIGDGCSYAAAGLGEAEPVGLYYWNAFSTVDVID